MPKLGFCGDNCDVCPRYIATQSSDVKQLEKVATLWFKVGYRDRIVPPEELTCRGCSSTMCNRDYLRAVRECAVEKGVENCGRCGTYPCDKISNVFQQVEMFAKSIKRKCSKREYDRLKEAFFSKKKNLDRVKKEQLPNTRAHQEGRQ